MKYLVGGSTGLVKLVETADRSLQSFSPPTEQELGRRVTCMCWSGGSSNEAASEVTVGMSNGLVVTYAYPSMERLVEFTLPSRCVYIHMLGNAIGNAGRQIYEARSAEYPALYVDTTGSELRKKQGNYMCCVSESGHCIVVDVDEIKQEVQTSFDHVSDDANDSEVARDVKSADTAGRKCKGKDSSDSAGGNGGGKRLKVEMMYSSDKDDKVQHLSISGGVAAYKFKGPITAATHSSLLPNRLALGGPNVPPFLFDIYAGKVLWTGKMPHQSLLGLQSQLDVRSICFMEDLGPDIIAVSTSNSSIYFYDMTCQKKPVYDLNVCDRRSRCISGRRLALHHIKEYNTERRKEVKQSVNEFYTSDTRNIVKLVTRPRRPSEEQDHYETKDTCDLFASDNVGSIYHFKVVTGDTLVSLLEEKMRKYQPNPDQAMSRDDVIKHLIEARKRFGSASANDTPLHCAPPGANQYICQLKGCYAIHNGAVPDIFCVGHYLISVGLDRFTNVYNVRTRKRVFRMYCNQKQTALLPFLSELYQEYESTEFKQLDVPVVKRGKRPAASGAVADRGDGHDDDGSMDVDGPGSGSDDMEDEFHDSSSNEGEFSGSDDGEADSPDGSEGDPSDYSGDDYDMSDSGAESDSDATDS
ncbi:hypothetical protein, conserved [Babesia bigemina]|uniref:Uncharacterized protein n=1 Tax=Babesia bigemina TaxID=5866 RepID=A0A061D3R7_BABBI|nr:hypothetical protein, conserved [Babesia bigemina]CDR95223.1 hypothetical protein, conserved [Babesia bigemina]|eukprot:XP_012767409.1 hypothetical protein, conserved [Babesia bigemina]